MEEAPTPKGRRRQSELLLAAREVFAERGYFETRVEDISEAARVSRATFYTYFDSKDGILEVLVGELVEELLDSSAAPLRPGATPYLTLEATIRQFMHAYRERAVMIRVLEQAVASNERFLRMRLEIRGRFGERLASAIRQHQTDTGPLDAEMAAYALGGMVDDFARGCYLLEQAVDEEVAIATMATIWARATGVATDERPATDDERSPQRNC